MSRGSQDLEAMLAELMRRSEEIMGRVEQQRHQERALPARLDKFAQLLACLFAGFAFAARQRTGQPHDSGSVWYRNSCCPLRCLEPR